MAKEYQAQAAKLGASPEIGDQTRVGSRLQRQMAGD